MASTQRSIAVFRALQLGDMLCAVPALRALRQGEPAAHITLVGLPWAGDFVSRYAHLVDDFMAFPGAEGMPEQSGDVQALERFLADARDRRFDLVIQLHGSGAVTNPLVLQFGAAEVAGFYAGAAPADAGQWLAWPDGNEIERLLALMHRLGYPASDTQLAFPLDLSDRAAWQALSSEYALQPGSYVCVHPGARMLSRRWPVERFAEVARRLSDRWRIVVTGSSEERGLAQALREKVDKPVVDLCGKTTLGAMAALIAHARLLVCNDTGASHIAAAVGTPSVVISCGSDSERWAPLDRERHQVLADYPPCRPCAWQTCPFGHECALHIGVEQVVGAAQRLTQRSFEHA